MKIVKNTLIGSSLALAMLTPTIMAGQNFKPINEISNELRTETKDTHLIPINEINMTGSSNTTIFEFEDVHLIDSNKHLKKDNFSIKINTNISKERGLDIPEVILTSENGTSTSGLESMVLIPQEIIDQGDAAIIAYTNSINKLYSYDIGYNDGNYWAETYNGDEGLYFALTGKRGYSETRFTTPLVFNVKWKSEYNNGNKKTKQSIFYEELGEDNLELKYKTKKMGANSLGLVDKMERAFVYDLWNQGMLSLTDPETNLSKDYMMVLNPKYFDGGRYISGFNLMSNSISWFDIDFSEESINNLKDRLDSSNYQSIDLPIVYLYDVVPMDETIVDLDWDNPNDFDVETELLTQMEARQDAYEDALTLYGINTTTFDAVSNSVQTLFNYDGVNYIVEKVSLTPPLYSTSSIISLVNGYSNILRGDTFMDYVKNSTTIFYREYNSYEHSGGEYRDYEYSMMEAFEIEQNPGFISSTETALILFSVASMIGLGVVIFFLIKSAQKEEDGVEIIMGGGE